MHVVIVSTRPVPAQDVYAREQSAALATLGHRVTVVAPPDGDNAWKLHPAVQHIRIDWRDDLESYRQELVTIGPDVVHAYEVRGISRLLRSTRLPTAIELRSVPLRTPPMRVLGIARMWAELGRSRCVGAAHLRLASWLPFVHFTAPAGWSTWAPEVRRGRRPVSGRIVYQGTPYARRLDRLMAAFARVAEIHPSSELYLALRPGYGQPNEREIGRVPRAIRGRIHISQPSGPSELVELLRTAHVTVSWVPAERGFDWQPPLKVLDAVASGIPLVATDTRATRAITAGLDVSLSADDLSSFARELASSLDRGPATADVPAAFLRNRSWTTIMEQVWVPRYEALIQTHAGRPSRNQQGEVDCG